MTTLAEYVSSRELMANLTLRELRGRYKRSLLGWAWSLLNPLAIMLIFTLLFRFFLRIDAPPSETTELKSFALYLLCALLPWNFMQNGVSLSMTSLIANANLIQKTYVPRELLVASQVASLDVSLLIEMSLLVVLLVLFGNMVVPFLPVVLVLVAFLTLFTTGLALLFSVLNVYFRDVQHLVSILFQVWFYLTPVVYPLGVVPERHVFFGVDVPVRTIYDANPMVRFVEAVRDCLYDLRLPPLGSVAYLAAVSVTVFLAGLFVFSRLSGRLAEEL
jgi:ABC-type polysaccharide/polyol phosphate export permease